LWLLSLIALALCLWGGFQMMTSGWDSKKYEGWLNILKWAAIGLAIIAASWLIVSLIFFVLNKSLWNQQKTEVQEYSAWAWWSGWE
jgi:TRAP-type C4-dicarboxylate transport system permease small subunit